MWKVYTKSAFITLVKLCFLGVCCLQLRKQFNTAFRQLLTTGAEPWLTRWRDNTEPLESRARSAVKTVRAVSLSLRDSLFVLYVNIGLYDSESRLSDIGRDHGEATIDEELSRKVTANLIIFALAGFESDAVRHLPSSMCSPFVYSIMYAAELRKLTQPSPCHDIVMVCI